MRTMTLLDPTSGEGRTFAPLGARLTRKPDTSEPRELPTRPHAAQGMLAPDAPRSPARVWVWRRWYWFAIGLCFVGAIGAVAYAVYERRLPRPNPRPMPQAALSVATVVKPGAKPEGHLAKDTSAIEALSPRVPSEVQQHDPGPLASAARDPILTATSHWIPLHPSWVPLAAEPPISMTESSPPPAADLVSRAVAEERASSRSPVALTRSIEPFVGVWSSHPRACSSRANRGDLLTAIDTSGAWAGDTRCEFGRRRKTAEGWSFAARCTNAGERWTSKVQLKVTGTKLTWASQRGLQTYVRCERRLLTAQAHL